MIDLDSFRNRLHADYWQVLREETEDHGFTCECELCKARRKISDALGWLDQKWKKESIPSST